MLTFRGELGIYHLDIPPKVENHLPCVIPRICGALRKEKMSPNFEPGILCHLDGGSKVHVGEDTRLVADVVLVAPVALVQSERPPSLFTIWIHHYDNISTVRDNLEDRCKWPTCLVARALCSQDRPSEMEKWIRHKPKKASDYSAAVETMICWSFE